MHITIRQSYKHHTDVWQCGPTVIISNLFAICFTAHKFCEILLLNNCKHGVKKALPGRKTRKNGTKNLVISLCTSNNDEPYLSRPAHMKLNLMRICKCVYYFNTTYTMYSFLIMSPPTLLLDDTEYEPYLSLVMRKPPFCIFENKDADQLRGNREADQRLCFRYMDSTIPLLSKSKISRLAIFCGCRAWFVLDLVGNPEDRFSHNEAHLAR